MSEMRTWKFDEDRQEIRGPWDDEPDKAQWVDAATNLDCLIVRNRMGALCGYVGLPPGHPLYGAGYDAAHERAEIDVHGGLTFADKCQEGAQDRGVCHVPEPDRPADVWWLGFDCAHAFDLAPGMVATLGRVGASARDRGETYRAFDYVRDECSRLAGQLASVR